MLLASGWKKLSLFKGMFYISLLIKRDPTGHTSPTVCCIIHVELVCGGQGTVYIVRGMHRYHKHKPSFFILPWALAFSVFFVHNESEAFHFEYPNCDLLDTFFDLSQRLCTERMFFLYIVRGERLLFKTTFFMSYIVVFNMAANCLL